MTLQLDTPKSTLSLIQYREHSHSLNLSKSYNENGVFTFPFANPFYCLFCHLFLLHNLPKHYSVRIMMPVLCNSSPISQKGGVAVLCPVAVLGTFPYVLRSLGTAKCNTAAKRKTMLRFARPPSTFWV